MTAPAAAVDVLVVGGVYCDLIFADARVPEVGGETYSAGFAISPGGVANRAVAAARAGASVRLLSRLGDDPLGRHVHELLDAEDGLDTSWVEHVPGHQSPVSVSLTNARNRSFITYLEDLGPLSLPCAPGPIGAVHVGVAEPVPDWVATLRARGTVVVGGVGWDATGDWSRSVLDRLGEVDVFVPNDDEAMRYTRTDTALHAARALAEHVPLAIVTRGAQGVIAVDARTDEVVEVPSVRVPVLDPTGAGDVFVAAYMAARTHDWDLATQLRFAGLCASLSVTGLGRAISAPHLTDLLTFVEQQRPPGDWSFLAEPSRPGAAEQ